MNTPIYGKSNLHGFDYNKMTWEFFVKLLSSASKAGEKINQPIYLVGSSLTSVTSRDIDLAVIFPLKDFEDRFGELPKTQKEFSQSIHLIYLKMYLRI